jgi:hypothetical protein
LLQLPLLIYDVANCRLIKDGHLNYYIRPDNKIPYDFYEYYGLKEVCSNAMNSKHNLKSTLQIVENDLLKLKILDSRYSVIAFNQKSVFTQLC